jgi:hypothetical protein
MRDIETKQIGDFYYRVKQLPDKEGYRLFVRLTRTLMPSLASMLQGAPDDGNAVSLSALTTKMLGDAVMQLAMNLDEDVFQSIYETLAIDCSISNDDTNWVPLKSDKEHWSGRFAQMMQFIVFALEVNYADFLGGKGSIARLVTMVRSVQKSKYPATSTGVPSESSPAPDTT